MVHSNKILTVSYGTFSCTLEGFDDSFDTMKAIAEYFRDLAADDRYFGAEPPQPDAGMLAQIAQREISRQVEAREDQGNFVLRATETPAAALPVSEPAQEHPVPHHAPGPVAQPVATTPAPTPEPVAEPVSAEPVFEPAQDSTAAEDESEDSIAAKLQRIRAVVSRNEAQAPTPDFAEDEHADAFISSAADDLTAALDIDDATEADKATVFDDEVSRAVDRLEAAASDTPRPAEGDTAEVPEDDAAPVEAASDDELPEPDMTPETEAPVETDPVETEMTESEQPRTDDPFEAMMSAEPHGIADEDYDEDQDDSAGIFADLDSDAADGDAADKDESETANILEDDLVSPAGPMLLKVKRADLDAAISDSDQGAGDDSAPQDELAEVAARLNTDLDDAEAPEGDSDAIAEDDRAEAFEEPAFDGVIVEKTDTPDWQSPENQGDEDLSRLMAEADEKMDAPESSSSRETYEQLRAAVAAAEAEKSAGGDIGDGSGDEAYREDLANVVKPRRPVTGGGRHTERQTDARPAPLKLVAEQRVDEGAGQASAGPVRPRRIATAEMDEAGENEGGFAEFASEMGATELPDLLEAAAAYMSFVEGRDQFSRPQLMNKVRQVEAGEFNREDGLRSFGQLLREGKIEKRGGGRFTASGEIGFRPGERAAG